MKCLMMICVLGCATTSTGSVNDCTLVIQDGALGTADKALPCLSDGDGSAFAAQWIADTCTPGESCAASCKPTPTACDL